MRDIFKWGIEFTQKNKNLDWFEIKRESFMPLLAINLHHLLNGKVFIILSDDDRAWFCDYFIYKINYSQTRPIFPFFKLNALYPKFTNTTPKEQIALICDMLNIVFDDNIVCFYIGKTGTGSYALTKNFENNFLWIIDDTIENSFYLSSKGENLDNQLIELTKIFDSAINAVLFEEVAL